MTLADLDLALEAIIPGVYRTLEITLRRGTAYHNGRELELIYQAQVCYADESRCRSTRNHTDPQGLLNEVKAWADARNRPPSTEAAIAKVGELTVPR